MITSCICGDVIWFVDGWFWDVCDKKFGSWWWCDGWVEKLCEEEKLKELYIEEIWWFPRLGPVSWGKEVSEGLLQLLSEMTIVEGTKKIIVWF